jgi:uncharacterized Zn-finger protein
MTLDDFLEVVTVDGVETLGAKCHYCNRVFELGEDVIMTRNGKRFFCDGGRCINEHEEMLYEMHLDRRFEEMRSGGY